MVKKQRRNSFHVPSLPPLGSKTEVVAAPSRPPLLPPTGAHFLKNVNLNGNLLDIPDPPSPPKRNARRQSSPCLLRPLPLHDRTNEEESGAVIVNNNNMEGATASTSAAAIIAAGFTHKRSRKSLCHVPSPNPAESSSSSLPQETLSSLICFDDDPDMGLSSKRQKRRESMILPSNMAPMKQEEHDYIMHDATNSESSTNDGEQSGIVEHVSDDKDNSAMATNKRRLSIVLPSDIASFQQQVTSKLLECAVETNNDDTTLSFQDNDDDKTPRMATRNSKRQSIMLPTDALVLQDQEANAYFGKLQSVQTTESNREAVVVSEKKAATDTVELEATGITRGTDETTTSNNTTETTATEMSSFNHITTLVREYCSLPQSKRNDSKQAQEIERLTGYALIPPAAKKKQAMQANMNKKETDNFLSSQYNVAAAKRELLLKLGDMVDVMDQRKIQDTAALEESTQCRVERSRNGKYRYFHIVTNRKVRPSEYQELYLAAIQQTRAEMAMRIQEWLRDNEHCTSEQEKEEKQCETLAALIQSVQQESGAVDDDRTASESDMEESPVSESSESVDPDKQIDSSVAQVTLEQVKDETEDTSCMEEGDTSILSLEQENVLPMKDEPKAVVDSVLNEDAGDESSQLLLPLPSRQDTSDDPEIAAAEQRLWSEIDQALERYSRQIIAIRQARACQRNNVL